MSKILVVEDEPDILDLISRYLEQRGHAVLRASSGAEGLELFQRQAPALVLSDKHLPDCLGSELLQLMQLQQQQAAALKTLLMTGDCDQLALRDTKAADQVIGKPFSLRDLGDRVERLLAR